MKIKTMIFYLSILASFVSHAVDFVVNTTSDSVDSNPGDGICEANALAGDCSLRAAIIETNALTGADTITIPAGTYGLTILGDDDDSFMGDLDILDDLTITGAGMLETIIDGNSIDRIIYILSATTTIQNLTLHNGGDESSTVLGGAILALGDDTQPLNVNAVKFENNRANAGGALKVNGQPTSNIPVSVSNSIFNNNTTTSLFSTNPFGAAIYCTQCVLTVTSTTISNSHYSGKALRVEGGSLEMLNSTISNNDTGGVRSTNSDVLIKFSTIVDNGSQNLSFYSFDDTQTFEVGYSVMQTSTSSNCQNGDLPVSLGYNVLSDISCGFITTGDMQNTDALLNNLTNNGGTTATNKPSILSPLIDQIPLAVCLDNQDNTMTEDQRGSIRPYASLCDIGAVEVNTEVVFVNGFD